MKRTPPKHGTVLDVKPDHHLYKVNVDGKVKWMRVEDLASLIRAGDIAKKQQQQQQQHPQQQEGNIISSHLGMIWPTYVKYHGVVNRIVLLAFYTLKLHITGTENNLLLATQYLLDLLKGTRPNDFATFCE